MRPILSYYGGKQRIAAHIIKALPPHTVYCELYCGGASVLFAKPKPVATNSDHYREVLNDHDERIINIYRCVQDTQTRQALYDRLEYTPYSRAESQRAKNILHNWDNTDTVMRAWAMVVRIQQSFGNKLHGGWKTAVFSENHSASWDNWRKNLELIFDRLAEVYLECDDALAVIHRWDSPQTCFYLDPPYVGTNQGHYSGFTSENLLALVECLRNCQGSFVLSGYPREEIPDEWLHARIEAHMSAGGKGHTNIIDRSRKATIEELGNRHRIECLWRVDRSGNVRKELRGVLIRQTQGEQYALINWPWPKREMINDYPPI